jgi:hypothetical protein
MNLILSDVEEHIVIVDQSDGPARVSWRKCNAIGGAYYQKCL